MKNLFLIFIASIITSCTLSGSGETGPELTIAKMYKVALTVDTNGEVHLSGNLSIPTPIRTKLVDVDWLLAFDIALNAAEVSQNSLYLLYEDINGDIRQDLYEIKNPFEITFAKEEWVRRIKHDGRGNIVIFVERRTETISQPKSNQENTNPQPNQENTNSPTNTYWCDDLNFVKLKVGDNARIVWLKVNLRSSPKVPDDFYANVVKQLEEGTHLTIIGGPECAHNGTWWKIRTEYGDVGWSREYTESNGYLIKQ